MKNQLVILLTFLGMMSSSCHQKNGNDSTKENQKPNIVLIMTDDVGLEHWSCYGGSIPTPNIDKLAAQGMLFTNAYAASAACTPSRYSINTGKFPGKCESEEFISENPKNEPYNITWNTPITENDLTINKVLSKAGYYTGFVGKFHIGSLHFTKEKMFPEIPENTNPDSKEADSLLTIYQSLISKEIKRLTGADFVGSALWENSEELPIKDIRKHNLEWITQGGVEFLETLPNDKPFFLNFNTTTLHGPDLYKSLHGNAHFTAEGRLAEPFKYQPNRQEIYNRLDSLDVDHGEHLPDYINHYNAGVIYMDDQVGALMRKLEELGISDNTLVIVTADHNIEPAKSTTYNKGVHVPFVVKWPTKVKAGSTTNELISFVDFLPTFAEIGNVEIAENSDIDGLSFVSVLNDGKVEGREFLYFEEGYTRAVSNGDFKLITMRFPESVMDNLNSGKQDVITHFGSKVFSHAYITQEYYPSYFEANQLYDLKNDPYEQVNLANNPKYASQFKLLKGELQHYLNRFDYPFDLNDIAYEKLPSYKKAVQKVKNRGSAFIPWWNRTLDFPPKH